MIIHLLLIFSVFIGGVIAYLFNIYLERSRLLLTFSSAYLLSISFNHLFPEIYSEGIIKYKGFFIIGGIFLQILLETITHGIEHGHFQKSNKKIKSHYSMLIGLCVHSMLESTAIISNDYTILYAIIIHKISVSIIFYLFLLKTLEKKVNIIISMSCFALSSSFGFLLTNFPFFLEYYDYIVAFVSGIFIHIATVILFESSNNHRFNWTEIFVFFCGILTSYIFFG